MEIFLQVDTWLSLLTLTILEIVLGIDNLVFIALISNRLPNHQQKLARRVGLSVAWISRLLLLLGAFWIIHLTKPLFSLGEYVFSIRDLFLIVGGLFLLVKATQEIHAELEDKRKGSQIIQTSCFTKVIVQIVLLDIIFSLDSVITAVGMTQQFVVMAAAISIAVGVMIFASEWVSRMIERHPTVKMLALSFLLLIGVALLADGFSNHIPRPYLYFAIAFSIFVESLNIFAKRRRRE